MIGRDRLILEANTASFLSICMSEYCSLLRQVCQITSPASQEIQEFGKRTCFSFSQPCEQLMSSESLCLAERAHHARLLCGECE